MSQQKQAKNKRQLVLLYHTHQNGGSFSNNVEKFSCFVEGNYAIGKQLIPLSVKQ